MKAVEDGGELLSRGIFAKHSLKVPALQGEVDSTAIAVEDGGVFLA